MNAPQMPDPMKTAAAQSKLNTDTAITQQKLNMVDTSNPFGSTNYTQSGTYADGTPKFAQSTTLNPQLQGAVDNAYSTLSKPFSMDTNAIESHLMDLQKSRIDPMLSQRRENTEQSLFNRGVRPGTAAYDRAMGAVSEGENDQWNQLALNGRQQALSELLTARNQPINEVTGLLSGTQIGGQAPQSGVAPTDYAGLVGQKYAADQQAYGNMWGGVGNLLGAGLGGWAQGGFMMPKLSDERTKTDISKVGKTDEGLPIYTYRYKGSPMMEMGVMAQEVAKKKPGAVHSRGGLMAVDYSKVA